MPRYAEIAQVLADEIKAGDWSAGQALPTIPELGQRFGVSGITIRGALDSLAKRGLVFTGYVKGRRGTIVRGVGRTNHYPTDALDLSRMPPMSTTDTFIANAKKAGRVASKRFDMRIKLPPPAVAERLGLAPDTLAVNRVVHQFLDDEPWGREASYFPRDLAEAIGLDTPHDIPEGIVRFLVSAGHPEVAYVDEITDETADPDDSRDLSVPVGAPLLVQYRTGATTDRITRVTKFVRLGRRARLIWEIGDKAGLEHIRDAHGERR